jgi:hypothetical protein
LGNWENKGYKMEDLTKLSDDELRERYNEGTVEEQIRGHKEILKRMEKHARAYRSRNYSQQEGIKE